MRGMSFGSLFLRSSNHFNGSLRGEKSVTTAPRWRSDTKLGRTSPTEPCSRWNWISKALHSCVTVAEEFQQVKDGDGSSLPRPCFICTLFMYLFDFFQTFQHEAVMSQSGQL